MAESTPSVDARLRIRPGAHVQVAASGALQVWWAGRGHALAGIPEPLARAVVARMLDWTTLSEVREALRGEWEKEAVDAVCTALRTTGCVEAAPGTDAAPAVDGRVVLLCNGRLGRVLEATLASAGLRVERVGVRAFRSCRSPAFLERVAASVLHEDPRATPEDKGGLEVDAAGLAEILGRGDVTVCALEGVHGRAWLDVNAAAARGAKPCLFVGVKDHDWAFVGPAVSRAPGPCLECIELQTYRAVVASATDLETVRAGAIDDDEALRPRLLADRALEEVLALLGRRTGDTESCWAARHLVDRAGAQSWRSYVADGRCATCRGRTASFTPSDRVDLEMLCSAASAIGWDWPARPTARVPAGPRPYRTVGIVGGGTAGYLTALGLRAMRPELDVSLIESSRIPVIGVGEATTPELVKFLHGRRFLNRRVDDLYRRVRPAWKLGIKFEWGEPAPYSFTFPFQRGRLLESVVHEGTLDKQSLGAMLMALDRAPVFRSEDGRTHSLVHLVRWAYHLDNERFVRYLAEEARASGVRHVDAEITEVRAAADGQSVEALVLDGKDVRSFDLYVDCTGFRSLLLGKTLRTPFTSYASTLFTDRAAFAAVPNDGLVRPYTLAETMDCGWCWRIPFEHEDHRGYVFSSAFLSDDQAVAEMRAKNPRMGEPRFVSFRSGRHSRCWRGNVLAVGNSYGFVEPLESTALHMIVQQVELVATHLPASAQDEGVKETLNRKLGEQWDRLRWFLGCHYRYNRRLDTAFWRAARAQTDVEGAAERIAVHAERAPLSYRLPLSYKTEPPDFFADDHSFDTILMGQRVPTRLLEPVADRDTWKAQLRPLEDLARTALSQADAIRWLVDERPDVLEDFRTRADSWLHTWLPPA